MCIICFCVVFCLVNVFCVTIVVFSVDTTTSDSDVRTIKSVSTVTEAVLVVPSESLTNVGE